ncbi:general secretion pathway protein GspB [Povalibacter sp.]|uniref:general secretion pathway protein GspB n=1 Tax=Povalibacter sp. TaxID=1962978 RepID=UPI002F41B43B
MSFILDALKKSENERQRTVGPSLADAPARLPQTERPWWAVAVAGLLIGNLAVLLFVLLRNDKAPEPVTPAATPAATPAPAAVSRAPVRSPPARAPSRPGADPSVRSLAEEAGVSSNSYDDSGFSYPQDMESAQPQAVRPVNPPAVAPARPVAEPRGNNENEVLPSASSLIASGTSLPDMRLDIHVYSNNPAERFVFINMRKYTEGQTLTEGPTVERITPDGAILNSQGLRFVLPRQ